MKRILLPTDFSENAFNAINYALQLFAEDVCTFYLLNTYTPVAGNIGMMVDSYSALQLEQITRAGSERGLDLIEEKLLTRYANPKHTFKKLSAFNLLVSEIVACVKEYDIDLIIMGTQGATGAKEIFLGTHTMFTIKKVKCPVIAVPSGFKYEVPKEILFATDYRFVTSNKHLALLKELCVTNHSKLNILNAYYNVPLDEVQKKNKDYLDDFFKEISHLFHITEGSDIPEAVTKFQETRKINLLVMIHNKHSFFENLLFKPVINEMVYHTNVPFLVIPSKQRMQTE
jgi:nucleotide-binding universal stress UspA family protein